MYRQAKQDKEKEPEMSAIISQPNFALPGGYTGGKGFKNV